MLRIHEDAIELVGEVVRLLEGVERKDPDLARQGRRAVMSVPLNVSEGANQSGRRREQHYRYALGSAREAWSVVRVAHAARYIEAPSPELTNKVQHRDRHAASVPLQEGGVVSTAAGPPGPAAHSS